MSQTVDIFRAAQAISGFQRLIAFRGALREAVSSSQSVPPDFESDYKQQLAKSEADVAWVRSLVAPHITEGERELRQLLRHESVPAFARNEIETLLRSRTLASLLDPAAASDAQEAAAGTGTPPPILPQRRALCIALVTLAALAFYTGQLLLSLLFYALAATRC
jgi:hypothetical protein